MEKQANTLKNFHFPRYREIPDVGLYLDQVVKYLNDKLSPLGYAEITSNMVSNYVKKKYISAPVKKQYSQDQIVGLIIIYVTKQMLSMDKIQQVFGFHEQIGTIEYSYDTFCQETEEHMRDIFTSSEQDTPKVDNRALQILHSTAAAVAHTVYLNSQFTPDKKDEDEKA